MTNEACRLAIKSRVSSNQVCNHEGLYLGVQKSNSISYKRALRYGSQRIADAAERMCSHWRTTVRMSREADSLPSTCSVCKWQTVQLVGKMWRTSRLGLSHIRCRLSARIKMAQGLKEP
jgi:hypothetical protein